MTTTKNDTIKNYNTPGVSTELRKEAERVFERICRHLAQQGRESIRDGDCMYRETDASGAPIPNGLACAAGCLIPLSEYTPDFESNDWPPPPDQKERRTSWLEGTYAGGDLRARLRLARISDEIGHHTMIRDCQDVHDNRPPGSWRDDLIYLAGRYGLPHHIVTGLDWSRCF